MARAARSRKPRRRRANLESPAATPAGRPRNPEEGSRGARPGRMTGPRVFLLTAMMVAAASRPPAAAAPATPVGLSAGITADIRVGLGGYAGPAARRPATLRPAGRLVDGVVLAVNRRPVGLQQILGESGRIRVAYVTADDLPARWQLYEGVAAVVVRDLDDRRLIPAQVEALAGGGAARGRPVHRPPPPPRPPPPRRRPRGRPNRCTPGAGGE